MSPTPPRRVCSHCRRLVTAGQVCACQQAARSERLRRQDDARGSASRRGYDRAWRDLRASLLARRPLCERCLARGVVTVATQVHHVVRVRADASRRLDAANLVPLCSRCHARVTLAEDVGPRTSASTGGGAKVQRVRRETAALSLAHKKAESKVPAKSISQKEINQTCLAEDSESARDASLGRRARSS